jgi:protein phosphatase
MDLMQIQTSSTLFSGFVESRIGGRSENQDSIGYEDTPYGFLIIVCDGMGGGQGGKTASSLAVAEIISGVTEANKEETIPNILIKAIRRANMSILQKGREYPGLQGMGTTCTLLLINPKSVTVAHVGDSRIYQLRERRKIFRTFDHSLVFGLVKQKVITEEQARLSAQSNVITRALGLKPDLEVELKELPYERGDRFLLCTDGIHGAVEEKELIGLATNRKIALGSVVDEIATQIDNIGRNMPGIEHDNLSLAILETTSKSILKEKMNKRIKLFMYALGIVCIISLIVNAGLTSSLNKQKEQLTEKDEQLTEKNKQLTENGQIDYKEMKKQYSALREQYSALQEDSTSLRMEAGAYRFVIDSLGKLHERKDSAAIINTVEKIDSIITDFKNK